MNLKPSVTGVLAFFIALTAVFSQNADFPRLQPDPKALEYFKLGEKGPYSWTDLARISLWASGDTSGSNFEKILAAAENLKNSPDLPETDKDRAEYVLGFMYKNILKSYSLYQTKIDVMLSTGGYNCVSSAVLYMILCLSVGINTEGVITKDHSFITIPAGGGAPEGAAGIDVETTNAYGFDPGNRKEFHDRFGKVTGFSYVPAKNYRDRQTISPVELVSLIMVNIIAGYERQNRFFDSVPVAVDRAALLSGGAPAAAPEPRGTLFSDPRKDLADRLFNFGAALLKAGKEEDCLLWAAAASRVYPDEKRWREFITAAAGNRLTRLMRAAKYEDAKNFIDGQRPVLSREDFEKFGVLLVHNRFASEWNKKNYAEAERILNEGLDEFPGNRQLLSDKQTVIRLSK